MSEITSRIAVPYACALFDFSVEKSILHKITADFQNLDSFLKECSEFTDYLYNPVVKQEPKREIITKILKSQINTETFNFLMILVDRDRINYLQSIITHYLGLVYDAAAIKRIEVSTASKLTSAQKNTLIDKLKKLTKAREILLVLTVDSSLIGGLLIKTKSKILDFSIKNQLKQLAKHLDNSLEL